MHQPGKFLLVLWILALLSACGGGTKSPGFATDTVNRELLSGVAANGAPLAGTVVLKDSSDTSRSLSSAIAADGSFSFDVTGLRPPFLLQATGTSGGAAYTLYSMAAGSGTCNVNPLTHLAVTIANGGNEPSAVFAAPTPAGMQGLNSRLSAAAAAIQSQLSPLLSKVSPAVADLFTDRYTANDTGLDLLFDTFDINVNGGKLTISQRDGGETILSPTPITGGTIGGTNDDVTLYTITGRVATSTGVGVKGAVVTAYPVPVCGGNPVVPVALDPTATEKTAGTARLALLPAAITDAQGNYTLSFPHGAFWISAFLKGYGTSSSIDFDTEAQYLAPVKFDFTAEPGGKGMFAHPETIAIDVNDVIYVGDDSNRNIQRFNTDGAYLGQWSGADNKDVQGVTAMAVDTLGDVFFSSLAGDIHKIDNSGQLISAWTLPMQGAGGDKSLWSLTVDRSGNVYALEGIAGRPAVESFTGDGRYIGGWAPSAAGTIPYDPLFTSAVADVDQGTIDLLYTGTQGTGIEIFSSKGDYVGERLANGVDKSNFGFPRGVALDKSGAVFVVDAGKNQVLKFDSGGGLVAQWGTAGDGNGQFSMPSAIAVDSKGNVYVVDTNNHRVQKFDNDGQYLGQWGIYGSVTLNIPSMVCQA